MCKLNTVWKLHKPHHVQIASSIVFLHFMLCKKTISHGTLVETDKQQSRGSYKLCFIFQASVLARIIIHFSS